MTPIHGRNETGASLIMVLVFITFFGLVTGAILDFLNFGFNMSNGIVTVRNEQNAVDGAMDGAINAIRGSSTAGLEDHDCPTFNQVAPSGTDDPDVDVTCEPLGVGDGGIDDIMPEYAILTLGDGACDGFMQTGNHTLTVDGGIFSNSRIAIGQAASGSCSVTGGNDIAMDVLGDAFAVGPCSWRVNPARPTVPKLTATGELDCDLGASEKEGDPDYPMDVASIAGMEVDPLPECGTNGIVVFDPGVYTEIPDYHADAAGCDGTLWWFTPGTYYFDFPESDSEWEVYPNNIVGGAPKGGWTATSNPASVPIGDGACDVGAEGVPVSGVEGVQFIFGGASHWSTTSDNSGFERGVIELCAAEGVNTPQRVAVHVLDSDFGPRAATNGRFETSTDPTGNFLLPGGARRPADGLVARKDFTSLAFVPGSVAFTDFGTAPMIPEGSLVTAAYVEVRHREYGTGGSKLEPRVNLQYDSGSTTIDLTNTSSFPAGSGAESHEIVTLSDHFTWKDVNSLRATYEVVDERNPQLSTTQSCVGTGRDRVCTPVPETASAELDSVVIYVEYTPPGFQEHDCPADCAFLTTTVNPTALFRGTFYAPSATLDVDIHNGGESIFNRGVIAHAIIGEASASSTQTSAPFQLPGTEERRLVLFEAWVGGVDTGEVRLRALVAYDDDEALPGRRVRIRRWTPLR